MNIFHFDSNRFENRLIKLITNLAALAVFVIIFLGTSLDFLFMALESMAFVIKFSVFESVKENNRFLRDSWKGYKGMKAQLTSKMLSIAWHSI